MRGAAVVPHPAAGRARIMRMKPTLLTLIPFRQAALDAIASRYELRYAPDEASRLAMLAAHGDEVRVVLTNGTVGMAASEIDACPRLELICVLGAGYENVAIEHARARGVVVANGAGTNDDSVADHAMALLLASVRAVPQFDRACRAGVWRTELPVRPGVAKKRLGILGMGAVGQKIARRAAGFEMEIGYHNRTVREGLPYRWFESATALAAWCDFLVVATPGGPATRHLVDAAVLAALGPEGFLVNIARGSVVDTAALADALRAGALHGAGLDVYEGEPAPPASLLGFDSVVLTPHTAGSSPDSQQAMLDRFFENAGRHFGGQPVVSPV